MTDTIASLADLDRVRAECRRLATTKSLASAASAAIPIPGVDLLVDARLLVTLLPQISERFGLSDKQVARLDPQYAEKILKVATAVGNQFIAKAVTQKLVLSVLKSMGIKIAARSVAKYIPLVGSAVAAGVSFGAMKLLANRHIDDCYRAVKEARFSGPAGDVTPDPGPSSRPDRAAG